MMESFSANHFSACIGQTFTIRVAEGDEVPLELVSVTEHGAPFAPGARQPFALLFLGPDSSRYLSQGTYGFEHHVLGSFDLFIVPLGAAARRMRYEAIFN